jgi:adhesin/invasin
MVGRRTVPTLTVAAILGAIAIVGCIEHTTGPSGSSGAEFAAHLIAQSGNSQLGPASQALPLPVTVRVTDNGGLDVVGATVTFSVRQGGGSVSTSSTVSDAAGVASTVWTMGPQMGPQQLIAFLNGSIVLDSTVFTATATNGPATQINIDAGDTQRGTVGTALGTLVSAKVTDLSGNPVPNAPVSWTAVSGGGQIIATRQTTDSTGRSFATWTLGTTGGSQTVRAALASGISVGFRATAAAGAPVQLIQVAGSGQTGTVGLALTTPLSVRVVDSYGNGVAGAAVSFSADQGTFGAVAVTDSLGGTLGRWTLGQQTGLQTSSASLFGTAPVTFVATGRANGATTTAIETGNNQTQTVRQTLPLPLVVRVTDKFGNPVAGTAVTWAINQGGGTLLATSATTDSSGRATAIWTLGNSTGSQLATLSVPLLPLVVFSATATAGALDTLAIVAGNNQSGTVSTALGTPLIVRVVDASGNPEVGASVIFAVVSGGGTVNPAIATTDASGRATANWTIGSFAGAQTATASAGAKSVTFVATGSAASGGGGGGGVTPAQIVLVSGNGQTGSVGAQLGANVVVKVLDASGIPVAGTKIAWTVAAGNAGGSVSPTSSLTDGSGQASTIWLLGSQVGLQTLTAISVAVPADSLQLIATANLGSSGAVLINSGNNQTGPTGLLLLKELYTKVVDQNNKPVVGARVTWTVASGGGSLTQTAGSGITNALGVDSASWTLGSTVGTQTVTAAVASVGSITFTATGTTVGGTAATIRIISGSGQVGRSAQALTNPLVVEVRDASGNTLSGISVRFTQAASNTDGFSSPSPVTTGADGQASVTWTLGKNLTNRVDTMAVYASPVGVAVVDTFTATARPEYRIVRIATPFLQFDTTGATIGAPGDFSMPPGALHDGNRDTLRVQVYDPTDSSGVQGITVTWATQASSTTDGHPNNASTVTDNFGFAKTTWVLRSDGGAAVLAPDNIAKRMFATATMGQVEFQASVTPGRICKVSQNSSAASQGVGTILSDTVTVTDCNGYPVPGASVVLVPGAGSGSVSASPVITNSAGQAFITWTLGTNAAFSVQTLTATASGKADPYNTGGDPTFTASNQRAVSVVAGSANSVTATTPVPAASQTYGSSNPITVIVKDQYNNVVSGQVVSFTASGGGSTAGTASPASATTNSGGTVSAVWTLGTDSGGVGTFTNTLTITAGAAVLSYVVSGHP